MSIRIWHQSFTVLQDLPAYEAAIKKHLKKVLRPETEVVLHGQLPGTYPANYPGDDIAYAYLFWIHGNQWIAAARAAERDGFDAFASCTLPNPMLREMRTVVDIPVVGMGETVFHSATMFGKRFATLIFIDRMVPVYEDLIRGYGLDGHSAGVLASGLHFRDVLQGFADPAEVIARFRKTAERVIDERGADVIIPGEVPLSILLATNGVTRIGDVPVLDTLALTMKTAEMMAELKRATGVSYSRHGWANAAPSKERLDQVAAFYGLDRLSF
jgi:Asp/Glu/hydantoin racemase